MQEKAKRERESEMGKMSKKKSINLLIINPASTPSIKHALYYIKVGRKKKGEMI